MNRSLIAVAAALAVAAGAFAWINQGTPAQQTALTAIGSANAQSQSTSEVDTSIVEIVQPKISAKNIKNKYIFVGW